MSCVAETNAEPVRSRSANEDVFRTLYQQHVPALVGFAVHATGWDRALAEDIVQETLLRAWCHISDLQPTSESVRSWLFTVARRIVIDHLRHRRARPEEVEASALDRIPGIDRLDGTLNGMVLERALESLSSAQREVIIELYFYGRTAFEASRVLGIPEGTVRSRTFHAIRVLREALMEQGVTGGADLP